MSLIKHYPDILDCIANLSNDEVFTPPVLVNKVLDLLPTEVWSNPDLKWLDPCCKTGVFLREIAKRLWIGLANKLPDENIRREHIFKEMLWGIAITELTALTSRRSLYYSKFPNSKNSVVDFENKEGNIFYKNIRHNFIEDICKYCGTSNNFLNNRATETNEMHAYNFIHQDINTIINRENMKFDVIIGNPPYQINDGGHGASASPLYHLFIEKAKSLNPKYLTMIMPARWYAGGKGLEKFRESMLNDKRIKTLVDIPDSASCFPGVEIKGGICYFLWDSEHDGSCNVINNFNNKEISLSRNLNDNDIFVRFNSAITILEKVRNNTNNYLSNIVSSRKPFGFGTNFFDFKKEEEKDYVLIYARNNKGYVEKEKIIKGQNLIDKYKVLLAMAAEGDGKFPNKIIGLPIIAEPNSCCTETYIISNSFVSIEEAQNFSAYLKTKVVRFLIALRKNTQHLTKERFEFVPDLSMKELWTDEKLHKKYNFNKEEVSFIDSMIKEI